MLLLIGTHKRPRVPQAAVVAAVAVNFCLYCDCIYKKCTSHKSPRNVIQKLIFEVYPFLASNIASIIQFSSKKSEDLATSEVVLYVVSSVTAIWFALSLLLQYMGKSLKH